MTVEIVFSVSGAAPPNSEAAIFGGSEPSVSSGSAAPNRWVREVSQGQVVIRLDGISKADLSSSTESNVVSAVTNSLPSASHIETREV